MDEPYMANLEFGQGVVFPSVKMNQIFKKLFSSVEVTSQKVKRSHYDLKSMSNNPNQTP